MQYTGWLAAGLILFAGTAIAGRPLAIDDADPADAGQLEVEAGVAFEYDSSCKHWDFPFGVAYGALKDIELGAGFGGQFEERIELLGHEAGERCVREHGLGDLTLAAKWLFLESCPLGARHALAPSVKFPTADDDNGLGSGKTDYDATWIASWSLGEKAGIHLNLGYSWLGGPDDDILHYGLACDYQAGDALQWVCEICAEREKSGNWSDTVMHFNAGFRWNPAESVTLDMAAGSRISGEAPDFMATAGLTWAFWLMDKGNI